MTGVNGVSEGQSLISTMGSDLRKYLDSLERMERLNVNYLLPGHGKISRNARSVFRNGKDFLEKFEDSILEKLEEGPRNLFEISDGIVNNNHDPVLQAYHYGKTETFLAKLLDEGRIVPKNDNGIKYFSLREKKSDWSKAVQIP